MVENLGAERADKDQEDFADGEREELGLGKDTEQTLGFGWSDPSAEYPDPRYLWRSSLNKVATGDDTITLSMGGADPNIIPPDWLEALGTPKVAEELSAFGGPGALVIPGIGMDERPAANSEYGRAQVQQTKSGHAMVMDDTPGNERILLKHNKGNGVELANDGSILLRSRNNFTISVDANGVMVFDGDLSISCKNLRLDATGDMDITVGGDMNMNVAGDRKENVGGSYRTNITGNKGETVQGNESSTVIGSKTNTTLGGFTDVVKGAYRQTVGATYTASISGQAKISSESEVAMSAPNMNLAAADMSVFGATGTIGGEGIVMYNYNMYTGHSVHAGDTVKTQTVNASERVNASSVHANRMNATSFHGYFVGDLQGTAQTSGGSASFSSSGTASNGGTVLDDNTASVQPTAAILNEYLNQSNRGIAKVSVDEGDYIKNKIVRYAKMGGIARKKLSTAEARAKLKDPNNAANKDFVTALIADGSISSNYLKATPPSIGRTYSPGKTAVAPSSHIRAGLTTNSAKVIGGQRAHTGEYVPDPTYNPQSIDPRKGPFAITAKTLVGNGIPISTFLHGKGSSTNLGHIATFDERQKLARHLLLQAEVIQLSRRDNEKFADYRLIVAEGVYKPEPEEVLAEGSPKFLAQDGRAITYELYNKRGKTDKEITYEFAEYLAENLSVFDEIRLDFDNLDPNVRGEFGGEELAAQITVIMPEVPSTFKVKPKFGAKTVFNGQVQSETDLVEIGGTAVNNTEPEEDHESPTGNPPDGWTRMVINGVTYDVGNDYVKDGSSYKTFSGNSARAYAASKGWEVPTAAQAAFIAGKSRIITMPTQDQWNKKSKFYPQGDAKYHTQQILKQTGGSFPSGLVAGHKKDVVNGGEGLTCLWGGAKAGGGFWQGGGCPHDGDHRDYSQGLRPLKRVTS